MNEFSNGKLFIYEEKLEKNKAEHKYLYCN